MTFVAIRFATSTLALTGETVSTLPEMYHEISAAFRFRVDPDADSDSPKIAKPIFRHSALLPH